MGVSESANHVARSAEEEERLRNVQHYKDPFDRIWDNVNVCSYTNISKGTNVPLNWHGICQNKPL